MLISCEKCSTTYNLDEAVIPAGGAPVQCTRCSHVFTAYPPRPDADQRQSVDFEDEPTTNKRRPAGSGPIPNPGNRPANQTMVFGAQPQGAPAPRPPPPQPVAKGANQTMVFGAQPQSAPAPKPANQTMVFGTPAPPPKPAPKPANQTMVFGTGNAPPPPAAAPANQTMVFGAQAPPTAAPAKAPQTALFGTPAGQHGAQAPSAPAAPANQTLVFGGSPIAQPPSAHQTVIFGTAAGQQAAAKEPPPRSPAANQTLVFGGGPAAAPKNQTVAFGTPAGQHSAEASQSGGGPANQTMVFGAASPSGSDPKSTQMFGAPAQGKLANQTMMFGKPAEVTTPNRTMAFGAPAVSRDEDGNEPEFQPTESTVRVDLEQMMRQHEGEGTDAQQRHDRTNLFAMSSMQETTKPDAKTPPSGTSGTAPELKRSFPLDGAQTLPPNLSTQDLFPSGDRPPDADPPGVSTLLEPGGDFNAKATVRSDGPVASTLPNLNPIRAEATGAAHRNALAIDMSEEQAPARTDASLRKTAEIGDEAVVALASSGRRRTVIAVVVVLLLLLGVGAAVLWQLFGHQLLAARVDPQTQSQVLQIFERHAEENSAARAKDLEALEKVIAGMPTYGDAHGALVVGLALELEDLNAEHAFLSTRYASLTAELKGQTKDDAKATLAKRINVLADRSKELSPRIQSAWQRLTKATTAMETASKEGSATVTRAELLSHAVRGAALPASEDAWGRLAQGLLALNDPKGADAPRLEKALEQVDAMRAEEAFRELPRAHFVAARLFLALKDEAKAKAALDEAIKHSNKKLQAAVDSRELFAD